MFENVNDGNGVWLILVIFIILFAGGGWGGNNTTSAIADNEILDGQRFDALSRQINQVGDGLCSSTYALNNSIMSEGRALQSQLSECCCANQRNTDALRYDMSQMNANTNAVTVAQTQKILDALSQNKIESLQADVTELKNASHFCGLPRINPYGYNIYATMPPVAPFGTTIS